MLSAYLLSLLLALPLAAALQSSLRDSLRHREAAERLLTGWDGLWYRSFSAQASGLESTFDAGVVGIGAVFRSLDALLRGGLLDLPLPIVIAGLLYLLGWVVLSGGLLARFGGDDRGLWRLGIAHAPRLWWIAATGWVLSLLVLGAVLPLLSVAVERACRDVIDERVHAAWLLGKYAVVWLLMLAIRLVVDYAKVAAVAEPSRSPRWALGQGLRTVGGRARAVIGVQAILGALGLALLLAYWAIAPGADQGNPFKILIAFLISQSSVAARVVMRALTLASEHALWVAAGPGRGRARGRRSS